MIEEPPHSKGHTEHSEQTGMAADQTFTNVSQTDQDNNGETLTLKTDHSFHLNSRNYSWDSHDHYTWSSYLKIDGVWSYDKAIKTITLTTTTFGASLEQPLQNQQAQLAKGFPKRVISTPNFNFSSKEIRSFVVNWNYDKFSSVEEGTLKRK